MEKLSKKGMSMVLSDGECYKINIHRSDLLAMHSDDMTGMLLKDFLSEFISETLDAENQIASDFYKNLE